MPKEDDLSPEDQAVEEAAVEELLASRTDEGEPEEAASKSGDKVDLERFKAKISRANREAENLRKRLKEYEDRDKSDSEKLTEDRDSHKSRADKAESELARYKVAAAKGLTPGQAKRLVGSTEDELAADADEMLAELGGTSTSTTKPKERLRGGGEPDDEPEEDISKVVADIPRI
ncbi:MAG TPA: hypothetical protein VFJ19_17405 [Nocardioidaceae bacterium]|nr:hypothetical protein [Nocardioidaceae bacterium]